MGRAIPTHRKYPYPPIWAQELPAAVAFRTKLFSVSHKYLFTVRVLEFKLEFRNHRLIPRRAYFPDISKQYKLRKLSGIGCRMVLFWGVSPGKLG